MASLLPGFEYDIFISYRHKDNKGEQWVSTFVNALTTELEATFKENISIYFDSNPNDGLLETHIVDKSLENKLRSLIFIPIISQTYCDTASFAWQHEFCAFNRWARDHHPGLEISLSNGNVASRILPVKIHQLDAEDNILLQIELGCAVRSVEFIYKEAGVNRPLKLGDNKNENQHKTDYRNQVNKIANAIKEIITSLKGAGSVRTASGKNRILSPEQIVEEKSDSVAVLPFANMSSDPEQEYFSDGISEEIINLLAQLPNLKVAGRTSSFTFKGKNEDLRTIGEKLGVKTVLEGSVRSSGKRIRITAQLIDAQNGFHLWSERYDRDMKDIFEVQDEIALSIVEELKPRLFEEKRIQLSKSIRQNLDAYDCYLKGRFYWNNYRTKPGIEKAIQYFEESIAIDPRYSLAYVGLCEVYCVQADWGFIPTDAAITRIHAYSEKAREVGDAIPENRFSSMYVALLEWNWKKADAEWEQIRFRPNSARIHHAYGLYQTFFGNFDVALAHNKRARELEPLALIFNFAGGLINYMSRHYDEALKQFQIALDLDGGFTPAYFWRCFTYLRKDMPQKAVEEFKTLVLKDTSTHKYVPIIDDIYKQSGLPGFLHWLIDHGIAINVGLYNQHFHKAVCYALLNDKEKALECLAVAYEQHSYRFVALNVEPAFDSIRDDPRFSLYVEKANLA